MEHNIVIDRNQKYKQSSKIKTAAGLCALLGLILTVIGYLTTDDVEQSTRLWSSLLFNDLFFTWIAISAVFFITAFRLGYSGWNTLIQRIPEAIGYFMIPGLLLIPVIFIFGKKYLYEWTHEEIVAHDGFLQEKSWWLNDTTFMVFTAVWVVTLIWSFLRFRNNSLELDKKGTYKIFGKSFVLAAIFLFFFAIANSVSTWHWVMSVEPHWYSTLYAWYMFASALVSFFAFTIIALILLKRAGYLPQINLNHFHDLGKFLFAFSIFWTYLWFSQYMLIWYANIPEETVHYQYILNHHGFLFYFIVILNFLVPLLVLMSRDAKRNLNKLIFVAVIILIGHWLDFFMMIRPGTEKLLTHSVHSNDPIIMKVGLTEIGLGALFLGAFIFVISWALSRANLVPLNNPFERESLEHHI